MKALTVEYAHLLLNSAPYSQHGEARDANMEFLLSDGKAVVLRRVAKPPQTSSHGGFSH